MGSECVVSLGRMLLRTENKDGNTHLRWWILKESHFTVDIEPNTICAIAETSDRCRRNCKSNLPTQLPTGCSKEKKPNSLVTTARYRRFGIENEGAALIYEQERLTSKIRQKKIPPIRQEIKGNGIMMVKAILIPQKHYQLIRQTPPYNQLTNIIQINNKHSAIKCLTENFKIIRTYVNVTVNIKQFYICCVCIIGRVMKRANLKSTTRWQRCCRRDARCLCWQYGFTVKK